MKKLLGITTALLGLLALGGTAHAQLLGIQFDAYGAAVGSYTAGYSTFAQTNWNSYDAVNSSAMGGITVAAGGLVDSNGSDADVSTLTLTATDAGATDDNLNKSQDPFTATGDANLGFGQLFQNSTVVVGGLTPGASYEVLAYLNSSWFGAATQSTVSDGATTDYFTTYSQSNSAWTPLSGSGSSGSPVSGNLAIFTVSADGSGNITITTAAQNGYGGLSALQIEPAASPEPSEVMLLGVGILGLIVLARRKLLSSSL